MMTRVIVLLGGIVFFMYISFNVGHYEGKKAGIKTALNTNPVSDELEMTCAGLWMAEQHKQAIIKENK
jgi:hypothetical protein